MPAARASGGGAYSSNLGVLAPTAVPDAAPAIEIDPYLSQRVSPESFANRGFAVDGGTAFVNAALLLLLVALATERIFGLNKVINEALRKWVDSRKEAKRYDVYDARQRLEQQWGDGDGSDSSGGGGGEDGGSSGGRGGGGL